MHYIEASFGSDMNLKKSRRKRIHMDGWRDGWREWRAIHIGANGGGEGGALDKHFNKKGR